MDKLDKNNILLHINHEIVTSPSPSKPPTKTSTDQERRKYLIQKYSNLYEHNFLGTVLKHDSDDGPNILFLEKGNKSAGLKHILEDTMRPDNKERKGHREHFQTNFDLQGSEEEIDKEIKNIILKAA